MRQLFLFILSLFVLAFHQVYSQDQSDNTLKEGSPEMLLKQAAEERQNPQGIADLSSRALELLKEKGDTKLTAKAYQLLGRSYWLQSQFNLAIDTLKRAAFLFDQLKDSTEKAKCLNTIGICFQQKGLYNESLEYLLQALDIRQKLKDKEKYASTLNNIGNVYQLTSQYEKALKYYEISHENYIQAGNKLGYSTVENNIGLIYDKLGKYEDALFWLLKALEAKKDLKDTFSLAQNYESLGQVHFKIANYSKAIEHTSEALELFKSIKNTHGVAVSCNGMAKAYLKMGNLVNAAKYLKESEQIIGVSDDYSALKDLYLLYSDYYLAKGDALKSRDMMKKYAETVEKMFSKQVSQGLAEMTIKYEAEQKDIQNKLLKANLEIGKYKLQRSQKNLSFIMVVGIVFSGVLVFSIILLLMLRKRKQEIEKINKDLNNLNIELEKKVNERTQELAEALKKAEESDEIKSTFLANMSHEIRTPMNGMLGFARMLENENILPEERKRYVEILNRQGHILLQVFNDIINISKIEAGKLEVRKTVCHVNTILSDLYATFTSDSYSNKKRNVELRVNKSLSDDKSIIFTDPLRLEQILISLIDNAFKFTNDGFIEVGYTLESSKKIKFFVKDTGIGIPEDQLEKIFTRFYKHKHKHQPIYGGTGIGLSISKGIAELIDGEIIVESKEGHGSCFSLVIPYIPISNAYTSPESKAKSKANTYSWPNKVVLVVEDDLISYQYIEVLLKKTGVKMIHVKNGEDAVDVCQISDNIDLVLMDMLLPFISGYEATQQIRVFRPYLPIVAQTANVMNNERVRCIEAGCTDYVSKPIDPDEFMMVLTKYLS